MKQRSNRAARPKRLFQIIASLLIMSPLPSLSASQGAIGTESYFRMIWGLLVVLGVILLLYGLLKKRFSLLSTPDGKMIKVTEMKPLGARKMLCLVEVKGEEFLLGINGDNITHLATLGKDKTDSGTFAEEMKTAQKEAAP